MIVPAPSAKVRIATLVTAGWAELTLMRAGVLSATALACGWALLALAGLAATRARGATEGRVRRVVAARRDDGRHARLPLERRVDTGGGRRPSRARGRAGRRGQRAGPGHGPRPVRRARPHLRDPRLRRRARRWRRGRRAPDHRRRAVVACLGLLGTARISEGRRLLRPAGPPTEPLGCSARRASPRSRSARCVFLLVPHPPGLRTQGKLGTALRTAVGAPDRWQRTRGASDDGRVRRTPRPAHARSAAERPGRERAGATPRLCGVTRCSAAMTAPAGTRWLPTSAICPPRARAPGRSRPSPARTRASPPAPTTVRLTAAAPPLVLSPGQPASIRVGTRPIRTSEGSYFLPHGGDGGYAVTSYGYDALQLPTGLAVARADGDVANPVWTRLPASVPGRVIQLGQTLAAGARDRAEVVSRVESYLRTHEKYRLDAPVPPAGQDVVDAFLFDSHEGFCEHFAAAETVLLRSVGHPLAAGRGLWVRAAAGRRPSAVPGLRRSCLGRGLCARGRLDGLGPDRGCGAEHRPPRARPPPAGRVPAGPAQPGRAGAARRSARPRRALPRRRRWCWSRRVLARGPILSTPRPSTDCSAPSRGWRRALVVAGRPRLGGRDVERARATTGGAGRLAGQPGRSRWAAGARSGDVRAHPAEPTGSCRRSCGDRDVRRHAGGRGGQRDGASGPGVPQKTNGHQGWRCSMNAREVAAIAPGVLSGRVPHRPASPGSSRRDRPCPARPPRAPGRRGPRSGCTRLRRGRP